MFDKERKLRRDWVYVCKVLCSKESCIVREGGERECAVFMRGRM